MNFKNFLKDNIIYIFTIIFIVLFSLAYMYSSGDNKEVVITEISKETKNYQPVLDSLEAKSFYVYDILEKKVLFAKDEHLKLPLASITKLMSGLVVLDIMPDTTIVTINRDDLAIEGDSGFVLGEKWKIKDLIDYSLITSSNDGIHAISSALNYYEAVNNKSTLKMMNEKAASFGLKDTIFINETGLDINGGMSGAYSSSYDVAVLLEKIIRDNPGLISSTNKRSEIFVSESNIKHTAINTNTSINKIPGLVASKTGFTDLAGGNLAVIFDSGLMHPVAIVVLGSTTEGRFSDVVKLTKITLEKLSE